MIAFAISLAVLSGEAYSLCAVGDVMLARGVGRHIERHGTTSVLRQAMASLKADIVFGNLECCLTSKPTTSKGRFKLRASPSSAAALDGFTHVALANNHSMDCGQPGLDDTRARLEQLGLLWIDTSRPLVLSSRDLTMFAFDELKTPADEIVRQVKQAKTSTIIVSMHWGIEYDHEPTQRQRVLAERLAKAGADLIIGHGPHVLQPIEWQDKTLVAYSLGNFVFDDGRIDPSLTVILKSQLTEKRLKDVRLIPMKISRCAPQPASSSEAKAIWKYLALDKSGQPKRRQLKR